MGREAHLEMGWAHELATIHPFIRSAFSLSLKSRRYNDDFRLHPYKAAKLHLAGRKRKGMRDPLNSCRDRVRHVRCASKGRFPLSLETPLHSETLDSAEFIRSTPDGRILRIWDDRMRATSELVRSCALAQTKWNARIPGSITDASGKFQSDAIKQMMDQLNIGDADWIGQLPSNARPPVPCRNNKCFLPMGRIARFLSARFPTHAQLGSGGRCEIWKAQRTASLVRRDGEG